MNPTMNRIEQLDNFQDSIQSTEAIDRLRAMQGLRSMPTVQMEKGGSIADTAENLASYGRFGDSVLLHVRPDELQGLMSLGNITYNPITGLPEAFSLKSITKPFRNIAKSKAFKVIAPIAIGLAAPYLLGPAQAGLFSTYAGGMGAVNYGLASGIGGLVGGYVGGRRGSDLFKQAALQGVTAGAMKGLSNYSQQRALAKGLEADAAAKAAVPMPKPRPAAAAPRKKVKATAANTKDFDKTMALQKKLQAQGFDIKADGIMGKNTRAAMAKAAGPRDGGNPAGPAAKAPTPTDAGEFATATPKAFTPIAGAGDRKPGATAQDIRVNKSNNAVKKSFKRVADAGGGFLDKIGAGISSIFKPSPRSVIGRKGRNVARSAPSSAGIDGQATPNAAGSNFASAADGSISRTDNPRQPGDATRTTRTTRTASLSGAPVGTQSAGSRGRPRRTDTSFRASDGTNTVARDASGNLNVRQRVTDPDAKAALLNKVNNARDRARAALAAGSSDPDDIRAYQRRMANVRGTGAAGGTDPSTF